MKRLYTAMRAGATVLSEYWGAARVEYPAGVTKRYDAPLFVDHPTIKALERRGLVTAHFELGDSIYSHKTRYRAVETDHPKD